MLEAIADPEHAVDKAALAGGAAPPAELLDRWRAGRARLAEALRAYPDGQKMPWYGPPMSATSMATARFMETWAHSLDVHEALGVEPAVTDRVRHIAHLGVRTRRFSFAARGETAPADEPRVTLTAPSGDVWTWGPEDATPRDGDRAGVRLLPARHPAHPPRRHRSGRDGPGRRPLARHRPVLRRAAG